MDPWAWEQLLPWLQLRATMPVGALFCVMHGATCGRRGRRRHANLGISSIYPQGIDSAEIIDTVHACRQPMISATAGLRLTL